MRIMDSYGDNENFSFEKITIVKNILLKREWVRKLFWSGKVRWDRDTARFVSF